MATGETGFEDVFYDLVSVQYHSLKAGHDYGQYVRDAENAGLEEAEVRAALADHRYRPAVLADASTAQALGATGVPFFVVDRKYGAAGAQPAELLLQVLERAWADAHPLATVPAAEGCEGDSCAV